MILLIINNIIAPFPAVTNRNNMKIITTNEMQKTNGKQSRKKIILEH